MRRKKAISSLRGAFLFVLNRGRRPPGSEFSLRTKRRKENVNIMKRKDHGDEATMRRLTLTHEQTDDQMNEEGTCSNPLSSS